MNCSVTDLRNKEVISAKTGCRIGFISDVEIDTRTGCLVAVIIWGKNRCLGLMGRDDDIRICWEDIEVIGDDTVLVCVDVPQCKGGPTGRRKNIFDGLFK